MTEPHRDEEWFGLVMPFVSVTSKGGSFDDESFVAGYECGLLGKKLEMKPATVKRIMTTVHTGNVAQLDLLAMKHGWQMTTEETEVDDWTYVEFGRAIDKESTDAR